MYNAFNRPLLENNYEILAEAAPASKIFVDNIKDSALKNVNNSDLFTDSIDLLD